MITFGHAASHAASAATWTASTAWYLANQWILAAAICLQLNNKATECNPALSHCYVVGCAEHRGDYTDIPGTMQLRGKCTDTLHQGDSCVQTMARHLGDDILQFLDLC